MPDPRGSSSSAGFTLIELLIAMLLFALISLAGVSFVEAMIRMQRQTEGRSERLAQVQRALFLIGSDFDQLAEGPERTAAGITLKRISADGAHVVLYRQDQTGLHRDVDGADRVLLSGVSATNWRFAKHGAWTDLPTTAEDASRPVAVELTLELPANGSALTGRVRRVIELPAAP